MPQPSEDHKPRQCEDAIVDDFYSPWEKSSQEAADLYNSGVKLWTKESLKDIEEQMAMSSKIEYFKLRRLDGSTVSVKNPLFGVETPIWRPCVIFLDFWNITLVRQEIEKKSTWHCPCLVGWENDTRHKFDGLIKNVEPRLQLAKQIWRDSNSCRLFKAQLKRVLRDRKITKVLCFGLGDLHRRLSPRSRQELNRSEDIDHSLVQHVVALTIAEVAQSLNGDVRLLAQDPKYVEETKALLHKEGFETIGPFGAGGFAEIDEESIVFSAYMPVPLKQILADIARPVLIITNGVDSDDFLTDEEG
ncbi:hypothetical protein F5Y16DRAFT_413697 [Xylariaceae sp. FL0255]|nr:hypothetical protein F5Y16DRAFT_413697 [Xylariaceae sp. FL0255]